MTSANRSRIPHRFDTLRLLRRLGDQPPMLMLKSTDDGFGTRWLLEGQPVSPALAKYLMREGMVGDVGATEFGARKLTLTSEGRRFRDKGVDWWSELSRVQKLLVMIFG